MAGTHIVIEDKGSTSKGTEKGKVIVIKSNLNEVKNV